MTFPVALVISVLRGLGQMGLWALAYEGWESIKKKLKDSGNEEWAIVGDVLWNAGTVGTGIKQIRSAWKVAKKSKRILGTLLGSGLIGLGGLGMVSDILEDTRDEREIEREINAKAEQGDKKALLIPTTLEQTGMSWEFPLAVQQLQEIDDEETGLDNELLMEYLADVFPDVFEEGEEQREGESE
jgi:hypothetical protein